MMNKRGLLKLLILLVIALIVGFFYFMRWQNSSGVEDVVECTVDADCVPDSCCHASSCVAASQAPSCEGIFCSAECVPGTLDCGQGSCGCVEGKCVGVFA